MTPTLSPNTQAILLLTAPLITGRGTASSDLLSPGEYKRLARHLREIQHQPADLVLPDAAEILRACQPVIDENRLKRLLERGFLLSQVFERWQARAIWVVSRADADYPRRLKARLREDAPAVIYGCGNNSLLDSGGLAVVGSRHVDDSLIDYTMAVGQLAARSGRTLVSGGAKGIDQAAMRGALETGGKVCGVLADSLEKTTMNREHRNLLLDGQLVLISPYDPCAGFNVGNAMQRNKLIYAFADACLVVHSDINKGGTWTGAVEQLDKFRFAPVYIRSTGEPSIGLDALLKKGALAWPNPNNEESFKAVFTVKPTPIKVDSMTGNSIVDTHVALASPKEEPPSANPGSKSGIPIINAKESLNLESTPANALFALVRQSILQLLSTPMKDAEIAKSLDVSTAQAKAWLLRLVNEGILEMQKRPATYTIRQKRLLE
ncbi:MAG: DNA-protecting protein DprA [Magnetococcales bacterium]|nr:DNA-protecting protein DprA [Magnetococcales bacterium]MBF0114318.1 DNA-protecting protein DprA [Magnetococcales bacterium]